MEEQIEGLEHHGRPGGEQADAIDHCRAGIERLRNEVRSASSYLTAYDRESYNTAIKGLTDRLNNVKASLAPKAKFSFKSNPVFTAKKNPSAISVNDAAELADQSRRVKPGYPSDFSNDSSYVNSPAEHPSPPPGEPSIKNEQGESNHNVADTSSSTKPPKELERIRQMSFSQSTSITLSNEDSKHIILTPSAYHATNLGILSMLHHCIVDMSKPTTSSSGKPFTSLNLKAIKDSLIVCGHVDYDVFLTNVSNSIIVVGMHESRNWDVYLFAISKPVIENCTGIRLAPLPDHYLDEKDRDRENLWNRVSDFNRPGSEQSPNWSVLDEAQRIKPDFWRDEVRGAPGVGVDDILKSVKLSK